MNMLQHYGVVVMSKRELDNLVEQYGIPVNKDEEATREWNDWMEDAYGWDFWRGVTRRVNDLRGMIKEGREALRHTSARSFEKRVEDLFRDVRRAFSDAFVDNEGKQFDFGCNIDFNRASKPRPNVLFREGRRVYHGSSSMSQWVCCVDLSPKYLKNVHPHFRFFMNGKSKCWVIDASEMKGHVFNDKGYRVFKAECFGLLPDKAEPETYPLYILDAPDYKDADNNIIFAHGTSVNGALNLLNRRVKAETLKRLSI